MKFDKWIVKEMEHAHRVVGIAEGSLQAYQEVSETLEKTCLRCFEVVDRQYIYDKYETNAEAVVRHVAENHKD